MKTEKYYQAYLEHNTISRRGLFRGLFKAVSHSAQAAEQSLPLVFKLRPPGAVDHLLFDRLCTGCGECEKACPEGLIKMDGQRPEIDFTASYCSRCEACVMACQVGALEQKAFNIQSRPQVAVRCSNTFSYCASCADSCERSAIEWKNKKIPVIDTNKCDGCGECAFECQSNTITMVELSSR